MNCQMISPWTLGQWRTALVNAYLIIYLYSWKFFIGLYSALHTIHNLLYLQFLTLLVSIQMTSGLEKYQIQQSLKVSFGNHELTPVKMEMAVIHSCVISF